MYIHHQPIRCKNKVKRLHGATPLYSFLGEGIRIRIAQTIDPPLFPSGFAFFLDGLLAMEAKETAGMLACALAASHERAREPLGEQVVLQLDHQPEHHVARQLHHRDRQVPA